MTKHPIALPLPDSRLSPNARKSWHVTAPLKKKLKLKLEIEIEYDSDLMHGDDEDGITWFREHVLLAPEDIILHSNVIGDEIGKLRSVKILEANRK